MSDRPNVFSRRDVLRNAGLLSLGAMLKGCVSLPGGGTNDLGDALASAGNPDCILTPSAVEGPFYVDANLLRSDITEGQAGAPLILALKVVREGTCAPIANAVVDIWHANAAGAYSAEASEGTADETFLRGVQTTNANGEVSFQTIYPGWYSGRTVHIHGKIFVESRELTTQFFFDDAFTDTVYAGNAVYNTRGQRNTRNEDDGILADANEGVAVFLDANSNGDGTYRADLIIGIN